MERQAKNISARKRRYEFERMASNASEWGASVAFWVRSGDAKEAGRRAKLAARWLRWAVEYCPVSYAALVRRIETGR